MEDQVTSTTELDLLYMMEETLADNDRRRNPALRHHIHLIYQDWSFLQTFLVVLIIMVFLTLIIINSVAMNDKKMKDKPLLGEEEKNYQTKKTSRNWRAKLSEVLKNAWEYFSQSFDQKDSQLDFEQQKF